MSLWKKYRNILLDLLFPQFCLSCGVEGYKFCPKCRGSLKASKKFFCHVCQRERGEVGRCNSCRSYLDGLWVLADYNNPTIKEIIQRIKYRSSLDLLSSLDSLLVDYFYGDNAWSRGNMLLPVPLHRQRLLRRGFNQATLIAQQINKNFGNDVYDDILLRRRNNVPQVNLSADKRSKNIKNTFIISHRSLDNINKLKIKNKTGSKLVLVDDVYTTGSTMQECAKILREAGFIDIWGLVVARG